MRITTIAALAAAAAAATPAQSAVLTYAYNFSAPFAAADAPAPSVTGSFRLLYDTASRSATLDYLSLTIAGTTYDKTNSIAQATTTGLGQAIILGGATNGLGYATGQNDFWLSLILPTGSWPYVYDMAYTTANTRAFFTSTNVTLSAFALPAPVPEPATWGLMLVGLGAVGAMLRRRVRFAAA